MPVKRLKPEGREHPNRFLLSIVRELWKALKAKGVLADADLPAEARARLGE